MTNSPHWTIYLSALLTPTIAILGAWIAYRQWRLGKSKLQLELFDRRFAVYDGARNLLTAVVTRGKARDEDLFKFMSETHEAKWLLSPEVAQYLGEVLYHKALDLAQLQAELEGVGVGEQRTKNVHDQAEIKKWFLAQYKVLDEKFSPYLHLASEA